MEEAEGERSSGPLKVEEVVGLLVPALGVVEVGAQKCEEGVGVVGRPGRVEAGVLVSSAHSSQPLHRPSSQ